MASKKKTNLPLPDDTETTFEEEHYILNYRPSIGFVEPEQESFEDVAPTPEEPETIDSLRDRTSKIINGLEAAVKLSDLAQKRIDSRVKAAGGVTIKLDSKKDAATIAAMKRRFPKKKDPANITYDEYKQAIDCISKSAPAQPTVTAEDIRAARADPTRVNFGGYDNQKGENRAEISSPISSIEPIDLDEFQKSAVLALFLLMLPLIKKEDAAEIKQHKIDTPHK